MTDQERIEMYQEWLSLIESAQLFLERCDEATLLGDAAFNKLKEIDKEAAYEAGDAAGWIDADSFNERASDARKQASGLFDKLNEHATDLSDYESCANIRHPNRKYVEVTFLSGRKETGLIYPWESDYAGPPYYLQKGVNGSNDTEGLDYGWEILSVRLI